MILPKRILFIGTVFPEPISSAAGLRTLSLLKDFLSRGDRVLFTSPSDRNAFSDALREMGIETVKIGPNDSAFDTLVREFLPDVVVFDRFMLEEQFGWRVAENAPHALRVLDTIDLHFLRRVRGEWLNDALKTHRLPEGSSIPSEELKRIYSSLEGIETDDSLRELAAIYRCDLSLIVSTFEERLLAERFSVSSELFLGLGFSYPQVSSAVGVENSEENQTHSKRKHFVSIGNFRHAPNRDSAFWLARVLWPQIRDLLAISGDSETELHLYGAYPPKEIMALDSPKNRFRVFGPADDAIRTLEKYRVLLAPIRFGAGIKGKIADAWAAGLPVVTTPIGAEGMFRDDETFAGVVAEDEAAFIEESAGIYRDLYASRSWIAQGSRALESLYSEEKNRAIFLAKLDELGEPENLERHRKRNFIGRMLQSEIAGRTKYMSRWIEEKNKGKSS